MVVNQSQIADFLGVTEETIRQKQAEGLPYEAGAIGTANRYDTARVVEWLIQQALSKAGRSKSALELEALELDVKEKRAKDALREKTLVPVQEIEPTWNNRVMTAAAFMLGRHSQLAGDLDAAQSAEARRGILKRSDAEFLEKLGVDASAMQRELEALLCKVSKDEADALLRRITGAFGWQPTAAGTHGGGVGASSPAQENPAV